jgi:hypothetical protein
MRKVAKVTNSLSHTTECLLNGEKVFPVFKEPGMNIIYGLDYIQCYDGEVYGFEYGETGPDYKFKLDAWTMLRIVRDVAHWVVHENETHKCIVLMVEWENSGVGTVSSIVKEPYPEDWNLYAERKVAKLGGGRSKLHGYKVIDIEADYGEI